MKKLKQMSAIAAVFLAGKNEGFSQIIYTNLDPDIILEPDPAAHEAIYYELDLNNDGIDDFLIGNYASLYSGWSSSINYFKEADILPHDFQAFAGSAGDEFAFDMASAFNYGDEIKGGLHWFAEPPAAGQQKTGVLAKKYTFDEEFIGSWENTYGKYVALRLKKSGNVYFGWARLSVTPESNQLIIHDYAYNSVPGAIIGAGETGLDCNAPFPLTPVNITATQAKLKWQPPASATTYKIYYREMGAPTWIIKTVAAPKSAKLITELTCDATYEWKIKASCDGGATISAFSDLKTFTTGSCRLENTDAVSAISIYPNPASDNIFIAMDDMEEDARIEFYDMHGIVIKTVSAGENDHLNIDVSAFPSGMYIISVTGKNTRVNKNFVKL